MYISVKNGMRNLTSLVFNQGLDEQLHPLKNDIINYLFPNTIHTM